MPGMRREEKGSDHTCSCKAETLEQKGERGNRQDPGYQAREANHRLAELQSDWVGSPLANIPGKPWKESSAVDGWRVSNSSRARFSQGRFPQLGLAGLVASILTQNRAV